MKFEDDMRRSASMAHPDRVDWRAVIRDAFALAFLLFCMFVMVWFVAPIFWPAP